MIMLATGSMIYSIAGKLCSWYSCYVDMQLIFVLAALLGGVFHRSVTFCNQATYIIYIIYLR